MTFDQQRVNAIVCVGHGAWVFTQSITFAEFFRRVGESLFKGEIALQNVGLAAVVAAQGFERLAQAARSYRELTPGEGRIPVAIRGRPREVATFRARRFWEGGTPGDPASAKLLSV